MWTLQSSAAGLPVLLLAYICMCSDIDHDHDCDWLWRLASLPHVDVHVPKIRLEPPTSSTDSPNPLTPSLSILTLILTWKPFFREYRVPLPDCRQKLWHPIKPARKHRWSHSSSRRIPMLHHLLFLITLHLKS
jgi:hypothetical protein